MAAGGAGTGAASAIGRCPSLRRRGRGRGRGRDRGPEDLGARFVVPALLLLALALLLRARLLGRELALRRASPLLLLRVFVFFVVNRRAAVVAVAVA